MRRHDGLGEVPGEQQEIVRMALLEHGGRQDWDVLTWCEQALFQRAVVDYEVEDVITQLKVMQKSGRLGGSSKAGDSRPFGFQPSEQPPQLLLEVVDVCGK